MKTNCRTATERDNEYEPISCLSKRICIHNKIQNEEKILTTSFLEKCESGKLILNSQHYFSMDNGFFREPADDSWQDLRVSFSTIRGSSVDQKVYAQINNQPLVEALLLPVDMPECESSTSCSGTDDDSDVKDEQVGSCDDAEGVDNTLCMTVTSVAYPSLDLVTDMSTAKGEDIQDEPMAHTFNNIENSTEYEFINFEAVFDVPDNCCLWPIQNESSHMDDDLAIGCIEHSYLNSDGVYLFWAMQQTNCLDSNNKHLKETGVSDEPDDFDPYLFIKSIPDFSEVVSPYRSMMLPCQARWKEPITLVLDLDETLVHSTLEHCDDADFTFSVDIDFKEHTVYVRRRPYLEVFMEKVAQLFEIIVFTASQSVYAEQLLNVLDPTKKLICRRVYRDSCVFVDGNYMKDLTILGRDLAKIAIIDNSPQAFRFQVDNGIPIESWFDDRSDSALVSLLPFLESLVGVEDVRPIIAQKFNLRQKLSAFGLDCRSSEPKGTLTKECPIK